MTTASRAMRYLRHEVARERAHLQRSVEDPLTLARALDLLRFFDRRLDAAVLIDNEDAQALARPPWGGE
jgi:hypothetical protein